MRVAAAGAIGVLAVVFLILRTNRQDAEGTPSIEGVVEIVDALKELGGVEWDNDANLVRTRMPMLYATLSIEREPVLEESLFLYRVECLKLMGKKKAGLDITRKQLQKTADKPDFLSLYIQLGGAETIDERRRIWNERGRILPISSMGKDRDSRMSKPARGLSNPRPPSVPRVIGMQEKLVKVGQMYEREGFDEEGLNTYLEALYAGSLSFFEEPNLPGRVWLKIAEIERRRGMKTLAIRAYLRAVRSWYEYAEDAKKGIQDILADKRPEDVTRPEPKLQKDIAIQIAGVYRELNLHPLALSVLVRAEEETSVDFAGEKQEILTEWNEILDRIFRLRWIRKRGEANDVNFYVLGQKVSEVKDWSDVTILRPTDTFWK